jgi:hypothetical protein
MQATADDPAQRYEHMLDLIDRGFARDGVMH